VLAWETGALLAALGTYTDTYTVSRCQEISVLLAVSYKHMYGT